MFVVLLLVVRLLFGCLFNLLFGWLLVGCYLCYLIVWVLLGLEFDHTFVYLTWVVALICFDLPWGVLVPVCFVVILGLRFVLYYLCCIICVADLVI